MNDDVVGLVDVRRCARSRRRIVVMTVAEVIRAAMELTPEERGRVADVLYEIDAVDQSQVDDAWASLAAQRATEIESGAVRPLTRDEANSYLDSRAAAESA